MIQAVFHQLSVLAANEVRTMQGLKPTEVDDNNEDGGDDHGDVIPAVEACSGEGGSAIIAIVLRSPHSLFIRE